MTNKELPFYTKGEEIFNAVTHIVGGGLGIIALVLNIIFGAINNLTPIGMVAVIIYGVSLTITYTMSSIYHFLRRNKAKKVFRIFDHCSIYLMIAGTYTPICLITLSESIYGVIILLIVWISAILGIVGNAINMHARVIKILSYILYVVVGWCIILFVEPLLQYWSIEGFYWMLAGGITFTIGVVFYACGKKSKYIHSIWHLFVLLGSILQYISIFFYIILA